MLEHLDIHEPTTLNFVDADKWKDVIYFEISNQNNVTVMPSGFFTRFPKLAYVRITTGLKTIRKEDLKNAGALMTLELHSNQIEVVPSNVFAEAPQLDQIDLSKNHLTTVEDFAFNGLDKLESLFLYNNSLSILKRNTFAGASNLEGLNIESNQIETIEDGAFNLPNLKYLFLSHNLIRTLADNVFAGATSLYGVTIIENRLLHIGQSFYGCNKLHTLILDHNRIDDIDLLSFAKMPALRQLSVENTGFRFNGNVPVPTDTVNSTLVNLDLSRNELSNTDILRRLRNLGFGNVINLNMHQNLLTDLDDIDKIKEMFSNIAMLGLSGNKLTCKWMENAVRVLKTQNVAVRDFEDAPGGFSNAQGCL